MCAGRIDTNEEGVTHKVQLVVVETELGLIGTRVVAKLVTLAAILVKILGEAGVIEGPLVE